MSGWLSLHTAGSLAASPEKGERSAVAVQGEGIVSDQPPAWDAWTPQGQQQYPTHQLYPQAQPPLDQQGPGQFQGQPPQQLYPPAQPPLSQQGPGQYQGQPYAPYGQQPPQPAFTQNLQYRRIGQQPGQAPPYGPQGGQPPHPGQQAPPPGHRGPQRSWAGRHKVLTVILAVAALLVAGAIGRVTASRTSANTGAEPGPTVTVTQSAQTATQAAPTVTVTKTVAPTANAHGEATQISADGVYVIGTDIPGGTWRTSGGQQCYEATLASTDTSNIIDNNNFAGPDTVSLAGAVAFQITGGCVWRQES
jgi:hypothetical protein